MQKIQVSTEIDLQTILNQLQTNELEEFVRETEAMIVRRKAKDKKLQEAELLLKLNEECVLDNLSLQRFHELNSKRKIQELPERELEELHQLIREEEGLRLKRVKVLGELSRLKNISINELIEVLGIKPVDDV